MMTAQNVELRTNRNDRYHVFVAGIDSVIHADIEAVREEIAALIGDTGTVIDRWISPESDWTVAVFDVKTDNPFAVAALITTEVAGRRAVFSSNPLVPAAVC